MVYKKYVYKRGKKHGPYYYHSYRDGESVKKIYIGGDKDYGKWKEKERKISNLKIVEQPSSFSAVKGKNFGTRNFRLNKGKIMILFFIAAIAIFFAFILFYSHGITGKASLEIQELYIAGESISGNLKIILKSGEMIPGSSRVIIEQAGESREFSLSELVNASSSGNFYAENQNISGQGEGFGFEGKKIDYPDVYFTLILGKEAKESENETTGGGSGGNLETTERAINETQGKEETTEENQTQEQTTEEQQNQTSETPANNEISPVQEAPQETPVQENQETAQEIQLPQEQQPEESNQEESKKPTEEKQEAETAKEEQKQEKETQESQHEQAQESPAEQQNSPSEPSAQEQGAGVTGNVVFEDKNEVNGVVSINKSFEYELKNKETAEIKEGSVYSEYEGIRENLSSDALNLQITEEKATVTTDYSKEIGGFGEDYLREEKHELKINLDRLNITAKQGALAIRLVYQETILAEASGEIRVENARAQNITLANETIETLNISGKNLTIQTKKYRVVLNRPVKWQKKILAKELSNLTLEIPKEAENISIKTGQEIALAEQNAQDEERVNENKASALTGYAVNSVKANNGILTRFFSWIQKGMTGRAVETPEEAAAKTGINSGEIENIEDLQGAIVVETADRKIVSFDEHELPEAVQEIELKNETEILVEYQSPGPISTEENITAGKKIEIYADEKYNYTDILAYTELDNRIALGSESKIRLYWIAAKEDAIKYGYLSGNISATEGVNAEINQTIAVNYTQIINESNAGNLANESLTGNSSSSGEGNITGELINESSNLINNTEINETFAVNDTSIVNNAEASAEEINAGVLTGNSIEENLTDSGNLTGSLSNSTSGLSTGEYVRIEETFSAYDLDGDGNIDYIEWIVPHLSNQTYEIIYITKAEELDSNKSFVRDVYEFVKEKDDNYTAIEDGNYLRVTFERNLTRSKDITIYARAGCRENSTVLINGEEVSCEAYRKKSRIDEIGRELNGGTS